MNILSNLLADLGGDTSPDFVALMGRLYGGLVIVYFGLGLYSLLG